VTTPGRMTFPSGSFTSRQTFHSCSCRALAASNEYAPALIASRTSTMSAIGRSVVCGPLVVSHARRVEPARRRRSRSRGLGSGQNARGPGRQQRPGSRRHHHRRRRRTDRQPASGTARTRARITSPASTNSSATTRPWQQAGPSPPGSSWGLEGTEAVLTLRAVISNGAPGAVHTPGLTHLYGHHAVGSPRAGHRFRHLSQVHAVRAGDGTYPRTSAHSYVAYGARPRQLAPQS
jgi:hypothetical protein